ncbi:MAG: hypothetical protein ABIQ03_04575, partial [Burkholderiales bacterium]
MPCLTGKLHEALRHAFIEAPRRATIDNGLLVKNNPAAYPRPPNLKEEIMMRLPLHTICAA